MCEAVRRGDMVLTLHAEEELEADRLGVLDLECAVLSGRIVERQRDTLLGHWKYLVHGENTVGSGLGLVARLSRTRKTLIITVFRLDSKNGRHR